MVVARKERRDQLITLMRLLMNQAPGVHGELAAEAAPA